MRTQWFATAHATSVFRPDRSLPFTVVGEMGFRWSAFSLLITPLEGERCPELDRAFSAKNAIKSMNKGTRPCLLCITGLDHLSSPRALRKRGELMDVSTPRLRTAWTIADVVGHSNEDGPLPMTMGRYPGKASLDAMKACVEAVNLPASISRITSPLLQRHPKAA